MNTRSFSHALLLAGVGGLVASLAILVPLDPAIAQYQSYNARQCQQMQDQENVRWQRQKTSEEQGIKADEARRPPPVRSIADRKQNLINLETDHQKQIANILSHAPCADQFNVQTGAQPQPPNATSNELGLQPQVPNLDPRSNQSNMPNQPIRGGVQQNMQPRLPGAVPDNQFQSSSQTPGSPPIKSIFDLPPAQADQGPAPPGNLSPGAAPPGNMGLWQWGGRRYWYIPYPLKVDGPKLQAVENYGDGNKLVGRAWVVVPASTRPGTNVMIPLGAENVSKSTYFVGSVEKVSRDTMYLRGAIFESPSGNFLNTFQQPLIPLKR